MNFMDLYKVCKPYCDYVEANIRSAQTLSDVEEVENFEDFLLRLNDYKPSLEHDLKVFDELEKLRLDIEEPIIEEVAQGILDMNMKRRKNAEILFAEILEEEEPEEEEIVSFDDIESLLNRWLGR